MSLHPSVCILSAALCAPFLHATPSGLNNIPTADVTPMGVFVVQPFTNFGNDHHQDLILGFKTGLELWDQRFEFGAVSPLAPDAGPVTGHFKYQVPELWQGGHIGIGIANFTFSSSDEEEAGDPFAYVILSQELGGGWRGHAGYGFQNDNNSVLLGIDKSLKLFERDLVLRSDLIQIEDESNWLASLGFLYAFHENFVLESWVSQPFDDGNPVFTVKLNFVFNFNDGAPPAPGPASGKLVRSVK